MPRRPVVAAAASVVPLPMNGSSTVSPTKLNSRMHRRGSSSGNGAGCPVRLRLSPLNVHSPFVQSMKSWRLMSEVPAPARFFHTERYSTTISSTGAITYGAEALIQDPHAVRREMLPSFHTIVEW